MLGVQVSGDTQQGWEGAMGWTEQQASAAGVGRSLLGERRHPARVNHGEE